MNPSFFYTHLAVLIANYRHRLFLLLQHFGVKIERGLTDYLASFAINFTALEPILRKMNHKSTCLKHTIFNNFDQFDSHPFVPQKCWRKELTDIAIHGLQSDIIFVGDELTAS